MTLTTEQLAALEAAHKDFLERGITSWRLPELLSAYPALIAAAKEAERLAGELSKARHVMRETLWMARRYADGRNTYAPGMLNHAVRTAVELGAIEDKAEGEPIFAADPLGAHSSGLSEEEYQRVVSARSNFERLVAEERKAERDAAHASGRKAGVEEAAAKVRAMSAKFYPHAKAPYDDMNDAILALIEEENADG